MFFIIETPNGCYLGNNGELVTHIHYARKFTNRVEALNTRFSLRDKFPGCTVREFRGI